MLRAATTSLAVTAFLSLGVPAAMASDTPGASATTTIPAAPSGDVTDTTSLSNFLTDLQNDPGVCIGFNPPPNCGRTPTQAGDRGGPLQYTVFGVMMAGLAIIGTVIFRKISARDKMIAESLTSRNEPK